MGGREWRLCGPTPRCPLPTFASAPNARLPPHARRPPTASTAASCPPGPRLDPLGEARVHSRPPDTADNGGIAQWYDNTLYISSLGQGISSKTFKEN